MTREGRRPAIRRPATSPDPHHHVLLLAYFSLESRSSTVNLWMHACTLRLDMHQHRHACNASSAASLPPGFPEPSGTGQSDQTAPDRFRLGAI